MTDKAQMEIRTASQRERVRVLCGIQCPECFGPHVEARTNRFSAASDGWLCTDCGCQWSKPISASLKSEYRNDR